MKKTYRKDMTAFDFMMNDCGNNLIDSIITDDPADAENVARLTFEKLGLDEKTKTTKTTKKNSRKLTITLIAAALTAVLVSTAAAAASGDLNTWFWRTFIGDPPENVFSDGNAEIQSDTVNINFHGVTGNEHKAELSMSITAKDGSDFIDEEWVKDNDYLIIDYQRPEYLIDDDNYNPHQYGMWHKCNETEPSSKPESASYNLSSHTSFTFKDSKTINESGFYFDDFNNIIGQSFYFEMGTIYVSHIEKVLYRQERFEGSFEEWENFVSDPETLKKLYEEYKDSLGENQYIRFYRDIIFIATMKEIPLKYKVSFKLNYRSIERELISNEKEMFITKDRYKISSMVSNVYSLIVKIDNDPYKDFFDTGNLKVQLKNGKTIFAVPNSSYADKYNKNLLVYEYSYWELDDHGFQTKIYAINPDDIIFVETDGVKLFGWSFITRLEFICLITLCTCLAIIYALKRLKKCGIMK